MLYLNGAANSFATERYNYTCANENYRTSKKIGNVTTTFKYIDGVLMSEQTGSKKTLYMYDQNGQIHGMRVMDGTTTKYYTFLKNLQGDVIKIMYQGKVVAEYTYDDWGKVTSITGSDAAGIGAANPIRYRGYYYDAETGFYYLGSRYYDPEIGRFINADRQLNLKDGMTGHNLYAYCNNNPIIYLDSTGESATAALIVGGCIVIGALCFGVSEAINSYKKTGKVQAKDVLEGAAFGATLGIITGVGLYALTSGGAVATTKALSSTTQYAGQTGKNVYYQVTSYQAAQEIAKTQQLIPSSVEKSVCVLQSQPTFAQAKLIGAACYETVIRFSTNCSTFVVDTTVPYCGACRNMIDGTVLIFDVVEVGFK